MNTRIAFVSDAFCLLAFRCQSQIRDSLPSIKIGKQVWLSRNLNVAIFANGDSLIEAGTAMEWKEAVDKKQPAWCYYDNKSVNGTKYGRLYNWYAVHDSRGLCPAG